MKVEKYYEPTIDENYIALHYHEQDQEISDLLAYLNHKNITRITGTNNGLQTILNTSEIYYFEAVDRNCFAYTSDQVYEVSTTLSQAESDYESLGFVRISKSVVLNVFMIQKMKAELNMRVIAILNNDEQILISRHYKRQFTNKIHSLIEVTDHEDH